MEQELKKGLIKTVVFLLLFAVIYFVLTLFFAEGINQLAAWFANRFGVSGMVLGVFVTDSIISPISPDLFLMLFMKSPLKDAWPFWVLMMGMASTAAGIFGTLCGRYLRNFPWAKRYLAKIEAKYGGTIRQYGLYGVVLGALTPIPFSVTCWMAGALNLPIRSVFFASLWRIPRIFLSYFFFAFSDQIHLLLQKMF